MDQEAGNSADSFFPSLSCNLSAELPETVAFFTDRQWPPPSEVCKAPVYRLRLVSAGLMLLTALSFGRSERQAFSARHKAGRVTFCVPRGSLLGAAAIGSVMIMGRFGRMA